MTGAELAAVAAVLAGVGGWLVWSARWPRPEPLPARRPSAREWMAQAGLGDVSPREFAAAVAALAVAGAAGAFMIFGGTLPPVAGAVFAASFPVSAYRRRRDARLEAAVDNWPRLLEEIRLRTGSLGASVPQALLEAGRHAPAEWRAAFAAAEREWLLTTDFARTVALLESRLADPTADAVLETLLVAWELGGTGLDERLGELIEDRLADAGHRKDAAARQAGVRFARRFVLLVPLGMSLAGLAIGTGRSAYSSAGGQVAVAVSLAAVAGCWSWSGRLMKTARPPRVFG